MGYAKEELAEADQGVEGVIIGLEDDHTLLWGITQLRSIIVLL